MLLIVYISENRYKICSAITVFILLLFLYGTLSRHYYMKYYMKVFELPFIVSIIDYTL